MDNPTATPPPPPPKLTPAEEEAAKLYVLAVNLRAAKVAEESAKAHRITIEEMLAPLIPGPEIGSKTITLKDGSKVTITRGFNYKADLDEIEKALAPYKEWPAPIKSKSTCQLDVDGYEWYRENHPEIFAQIAQHVSVTPKKVSVVLREKP